MFVEMERPHIIYADGVRIVPHDLALWRQTADATFTTSSQLQCLFITGLASNPPNQGLELAILPNVVPQQDAHAPGRHT
jgi:hypothetical protein